MRNLKYSSQEAHDRHYGHAAIQKRKRMRKPIQRTNVEMLKFGEVNHIWIQEIQRLKVI